MRYFIGAGTRRALAVLLLGLPTIGGQAQEPRRLAQSDSVPLELVTGLVGAGGLGGGEPQILVGSLPGWIENHLYLPPSARVVGAAFLGTTVVGIVHVPDAPDAAIADYKRELPKLGWKTPPPAPSYGGGFRPAPAGESPTRLTLCGDQQTLTATATRHRGTITEVVIRVVGGGNYSVCNPPQMPTGMSRVPLPILYNPANPSDARVVGACSSGWGGGTSGTNTTLRSTMQPEVLLDHYGRQLQDSGWHATSERPTIFGRSWTRTDSTGAPFEVQLTLTTAPGDSTCRDLSMQVRVLRKP